MKGLIALSMLVTFPLVGWSAGPEEILRSAWRDPSVRAHALAADYADGGRNYNFFDSGVEVVLDAGDAFEKTYSYFDDYVNQPKKVGLRFYPKGITEFRRGLRYQEAIAASESAFEREELSKVLSVRYNLIARVALLQGKRDLAQGLAKLSQRANSALSYSARRDRSELKNFLKMKNDLQKSSLRLVDLERDYTSLANELKDLSLPSPETVDLKDLASPADIERQLPALEKATEKESLSSQVVRAEVERSMRSVAFEKAQDEKWLDRIEIATPISKTKGKDIWALELTFNIPFGAGNDPRFVDQAAKEMRTRAQSLRDAGALGSAHASAVAELKSLLDLHKTLTQSSSMMSSDRLRKASEAIAAQDPLLALDLQKGWYEVQEQVLDLEFRIRSLYITCLHESSLIASNPDVNQLSKSGKRIL